MSDSDDSSAVSECSFDVPADTYSSHVGGTDAKGRVDTNGDSSDEEDAEDEEEETNDDEEEGEEDDEDDEEETEEAATEEGETEVTETEEGVADEEDDEDEADDDDDDDEDDDDDDDAGGSFGGGSSKDSFGGQPAPEDSSSEDSDSSNSPKPKKVVKNTIPSLVPEGISEQAKMAFFSKPIDDDDAPKPVKRGAKSGKNDDLDSSTHMIEENVRAMQRRCDEMSASIHSILSCEELLKDVSKDILSSDDDDGDGFVDDVSIEELAEHYKKEPKSLERKVTATTMLQNKREMRMNKVRERIQKKEEEKEHEEDKKLEQKMKQVLDTSAAFDMSESARRDRAYKWYTRMGQPARDAMKERVETMPVSSGISVDDVDLLPWNASGKHVNIAKMQRYINESFKKTFTSRTAKPAGGDSDSD